MMPSREIESLISLLGDRSARVRNRVATRIEDGLPGLRPHLEDHLKVEVDPLVRERLLLILGLGGSADPATHWSIMKEQLSYGLRDGMAAISLLDQESRTSRIEVLRGLDGLADGWFNQLPEGAPRDDKVLNLMAFLFGKDRFVGNAEDYYSLDNCFIHRVLEHKRGLPVTLSILAVILAEEAGLPLYGIGLPLHFIVGYFQGPKGIRFFDCFDGGREVTKEECVQYLHSRGIFFHPQLLSPCDNEAILNRVLVNIKHIAQRSGDVSQLTVLEEFIGSGELRTY